MNKKKFKDIIRKQYSYYQLQRNRKVELNKIHDPKRIKIYKPILLSKIQKEQIDRFYKDNLGETIPYEWHREYTAFTGKFDYRYFPELLYIPEFEKYMNPNNAYNTVFENKNILPYLAFSNDVKMSKTIASSRNGYLCCGHESGLTLEQLINKLFKIGGLMFVKPSVDSSSGLNCKMLNLKVIKKDELYSFFKEMGTNYVIQECIECCDDIKKLNPSSVNTFRIITYRWKNDIYHMPSIMRIGVDGKIVDNAHAGGIFIGISDKGILNDKAFTEFGDTFEKHPDSNIVFHNYKINCFEKCLQSAYTMIQSLPEVGVINWDFTIDKDNNPILIEANISGGSIWLTQMANGVGCFEERTGEILKWIRKMRKIHPSDYTKHMCGL